MYARQHQLPNTCFLISKKDAVPFYSYSYAAAIPVYFGQEISTGFFILFTVALSYRT
jgi:hypothetical protein